MPRSRSYYCLNCHQWVLRKYPHVLTCRPPKASAA